MKKILIVDDNNVNVKVLTKLVGYIAPDITTLTASNGQEALDITEQHYEEIALIFMDIMMPLMSGLEATEKIRSLEQARNSSSPLPIIAVTAYGKDFSEDKCIAAGMTSYMEKPVRKAAVATVLTQYLST